MAHMLEGQNSGKATNFFHNKQYHKCV